MDKLATSNFEMIRAVLSEGHQLKEVILANQNLSHEHIEDLYDLLMENEALVELNLANNLLGPLGAKVIADLLNNHPSLTKINISNNLIGNHGVKAIMEAVVTNDRLLVCEVAESQPSIIIKHCIDRIKQKVYENCMRVIPIY